VEVIFVQVSFGAACVVVKDKTCVNPDVERVEGVKAKGG